MSISNYAELKILDHITGRAAWTMPSGLYIRLHTGDAGEDGTANVFTDSTRKLLAWGSAAAAGAIAATGSPVCQWSPITASGVVTHWSIWDASTGGNCIWTGALAASKTLTSGNVFQLDAASLTLD